ncbi:MAG: arsenate reductase family protein [Bacillota bacterium]
MLFVCYPGCSTCAKAQRYLEERGIEFEIRNIKADRPTLEELALWQQKSRLPLRRFFNTSGQKYRELNLSERLGAMNEPEQLALLASDGMLVKRPLLIDGERVLAGFREKEWEEAFR